MIILALPLLAPSAVRSGEWRVTPIRLDFGRDARSGAIRIFNEAQGKLQVQLKALEWTQDEEGKDIYAETEDILFFPRMLVIEAAEERIVRVGIRMPAPVREKAYRLFIEEIPASGMAEGANVSIAIRFGVPVFIKPLIEEPKGEIDGMGMSNGNIDARVRNTGNVHFMARSVSWKGTNARGEKVFERELGGWYLLAGASRRYATELPRDACKEVSRVQIEVKTDKVTLAGDFSADRMMCAP